MKTAQEIIGQMESVAAKHKPDVRRVATMNVGEWVRQGDVMLERVEGVPQGEASGVRQLAPGTSRGSRHIIAGSVDCAIVMPENRGPLDGPCIDAKSRLVIEHPEHGWLDLPAGQYRTYFQRDFARERAEEIRRVQD